MSLEPKVKFSHIWVDLFFKELDTRQELCSGHFVSFFNEVDTRKEPSSFPDSFFNEVDTVNELSSNGGFMC